MFLITIFLSTSFVVRFCRQVCIPFSICFRFFNIFLLLLYLSFFQLFFSTWKKWKIYIIKTHSRNILLLIPVAGSVVGFEKNIYEMFSIWKKCILVFIFPRKILINLEHPNCVQHFGLVEKSVLKCEIPLI